jgi:hypothetical protein
VEFRWNLGGIQVEFECNSGGIRVVPSNAIELESGNN